VVVLVVDQMRSDYVERYGHQWTRGLRRLLDRGAWFRQAAYPYFDTETCPGHATISTGSFPASHGIVLNVWWDRASGKQQECTEDPQARPVSYGGPVERGDSPARLLLPTLADEIRLQVGAASRVVSMSMKPRSAVLLAGHRGDAVTWFDSTGAWVTSAAYTSSPVPFVLKFVKKHPVENDFGGRWARALPESAYLFADDAPGESPPEGWSATFPHELRGRGDKPDAAFYALWRSSPFSDAYLGGMAAAALDALALGRGPGIDFLGVSFSALDYAGHAFGPRSHEVQDVLVRLDATLGTLLEHLDRVVGPENYVVAFSADHGVAPIPEQSSREGFDAGRVMVGEVVGRVEQALVPHLGAGPHVARMNSTDLYFATGVYQKLAANPAAMDAAISAILSVPGVSRVFRSEQLAGRPATDDPVARALSLSYYPGRRGDLIAVPKPYWFFVNTNRWPGYATAHGTSYGYDTRVPLILMGRGIKPGEYLSPASPADIVPTLALLCGVTLTRSDGRVLTEALATLARPAPQPAARH